MRPIDLFLNKKVIILHQDCLIKQAARAMCDNNVGCVLISDTRGRFVGLVTDRDLACYPLAFDIAPTEPLSRVMTTEPIFLDESASLETVIRLMEENGIRRIPVVSRTDRNPRKAIGIISLDDLIVARAISQDEARRVVQAQVKTAHAVPKEKHNEFVSEDRAEARATQTLGRFHHVIEKATELSSIETQKTVWILLANIIRRLPPGAAANFAAQLPKQLQDELLGLPTGPDTTITKESIVQQIATHLNRPAKDARKIVEKTFSAMDGLLGRGEILHLKDQLPRSMRDLILCKADKSPASPNRKTILKSKGSGANAADIQ